MSIVGSQTVGNAGGKPFDKRNRFTPPPPIRFFPGAIPEELKALGRRFVSWRWMWKTDKKEDGDAAAPETGRWDKPPFQPFSPGVKAAVNDAATWGTFDQATNTRRAIPTFGVGFVLTGDGYIAVDLDHCRNPLTGEIAAWSQEIIDTFKSYTEISPSLTGIRILIKGEKPGDRCKTDYCGGDVEIYGTKRYVTLTGDRVGDCNTVEHRQCELEAVYELVFGPPEPDKAEPAKRTPPPSANGNGHRRRRGGRRGPAYWSDAELLKRAMDNPRNGAVIASLWHGGCNGYASQSEADAALAAHLWFWTGGDRDRVDQLFRQSDLYRSKWDEKHSADGRTYGEMTLDRSCKGRVYAPDYRSVDDAGADLAKKHGRRAGPAGCAPPGGNGNGGSGGDGGDPVGPMGDCPPAMDVVEGKADPHRLARLYLADRSLDGVSLLRYWREEFHAWDGGAYARVHEKEVRAGLTRRVKEEFDRLNRIEVRGWQETGGKGPPPQVRPVTGKLVADVAHALTSECVVSGRLNQPAWLDGDGPHPADELLVCRNGVLHLPSWAAGNPQLLPLTPRLFTANAVPCDCDQNAPPPARWLEFLSQLWPDDPRSVETLQEWFGYMLLPDTRHQKILLFVGPRRSGKGTIARVLTQLVGPNNCCGPTLASLGQNFGLQPLLGKTVAIISDARLSGRTDAAIVVERLLAISGEDGLTADRKHLSAVTGRLPVRFSILTNELPRLDDASNALTGRLVILRLVQSFYGREDTRLTDKLLAELPGILLWAMEGWRRLRDRGYFVEPPSSARLKQQMEDLASPIGAFLRECCAVGPGFEVPIPDLFARWERWCADKGHDARSEPCFGRDLRAAVPHLGDTNRRLGALRVRFYLGIRLRHDGEDEE